MKRDKVLTFRCTEAEAEAIRKTAKRLGRSTADVIRLAAVGVAEELRAQGAQDKPAKAQGTT